MNLRLTAEDASWSAREAIWDLEERYLWRGSRVAGRGADAAYRSLDRVAAVFEPPLRVVQTRLAWPLADAMSRRGEMARTAIATTAVLAAVGAGAAGVKVATGGGSVTAEASASASVLPQVDQIGTITPAAATTTLNGVRPNFASNPAGEIEGDPAAIKTGTKPTTLTQADAVAAATEFADAFVSYEVGDKSDEIAQVFARTTSPVLAKALAARPPRQPDVGGVPKARVLNVLIGKTGKQTMQVSVSIARLESISEIRLTMHKASKRWVVSEVLA